jgi:hypothetical protein
MESIDQSVKTFFDNPIVLGIIAIFITMYGPRLSPKLPDFVRDAFNNGVFRFIIMVLVIFTGLKDIRLALIISVLFIGIMSIVNTQNIKEDYHNQVQEYYANYNLFEGNMTEHFEDFHENYADIKSPVANMPQQPQLMNANSVPDGNLLNQPEPRVKSNKPKKNVDHNEEEEEDDEELDNAMNELTNVEKDLDNTINELDQNNNSNKPSMPSNQHNNSYKLKKKTDSRVAKYIDTTISVLKDMDKYSKTPGSGVSEKCQNEIKIPNDKCLREIKSHISAQNLSEITKNKISRKFEETKWLDD